ncbi:MAG: hypothetical protein ACP5Q1_04620 [Anaerolineae bacterium]
MKSRSSVYGTLSAGLLLIGLGVIFLLKLSLFPAILAVLGISSIAAGLATGRGWYSIQSGLWLIGLFLLFQFQIFWPGILILIGVSTLIGALTRPMLRSSTSPEKGEEQSPQGQ